VIEAAPHVVGGHRRELSHDLVEIGSALALDVGGGRSVDGIGAHDVMAVAACLGAERAHSGGRIQDPRAAKGVVGEPEERRVLRERAAEQHDVVELQPRARHSDFNCRLAASIRSLFASYDKPAAEVPSGGYWCRRYAG